MKTLRLFIVLICISIYLLSCDKEDKKVIVTNDYLPLEIGNYWKLEYTDKTEVVGIKEINDKSYYALIFRSDTSYYRIESDKIYVIEILDNESTESVKYDLTAEVNETWNFHVVTVTLISKTDSITINDTEITNCYQFYFDIPDMIDEEHSIWLAPGIGLIQEQCFGECLYLFNKLDKARIGGQDIDF